MNCWKSFLLGIVNGILLLVMGTGYQWAAHLASAAPATAWNACTGPGN